jgi:hypothetical protein
LRSVTNLIASDETLRLALQSILTKKACDNESLYQRLWAVGLIEGEDRHHVVFRSRVYEDLCRKVLRNFA